LEKTEVSQGGPQLTLWGGLFGKSKRGGPWGGEEKTKNRTPAMRMGKKKILRGNYQLQKKTEGKLSPRFGNETLPGVWKGGIPN